MVLRKLLMQSVISKGLKQVRTFEGYHKKAPGIFPRAFLVPGARVELARHCCHTPLKRACLPVSPPGRQMVCKSNLSVIISQQFVLKLSAAGFHVVFLIILNHIFKPPRSRSAEVPQLFFSVVCH